jgi:TatD DNase family protein
MHCFSGGPDLALEFCGMGFYISIPGIVTFRNAKALPRVTQAVPLDRLLIETDCPFLAPEPHRGSRNEPSYVRLVADKVAKLRGESTEKIAEATTKNAFSVYNIER